MIMILLVRGAKAATSEHSFGPYELGIKLKSVLLPRNVRTIANLFLIEFNITLLYFRMLVFGKFSS